MDLSPGVLNLILGLLLASCFVKVFTTLTILRCGLGLWQWEFGIPILALALGLTVYGMEPYVGVSEYFAGETFTNLAQFRRKVEPFLRSSTDPSVYARLRSYKGSGTVASTLASPPTTNPSSDPTPTLSYPPTPTLGEAKPSSDGADDFGLLIASFLVSELKEAFSMGFVLLIPFLVVDLVVMNLLMVLGVREFNPEVISVPLKILLFFAVDGWTLLAGKLLRGAL